MTHCLKIWPLFFRAVSCGEKTFEFRKDDRDFKRGDILILQEWEPENKSYTGKETAVRVTYLMLGGELGLPAGYCIMSVEQITLTPEKY